MAEVVELDSVKDALRASVLQDQSDNVVDFAVERIERRGETLTQSDVTPEDLLRFALSECQKQGNVTKCYITMIMDEGDSLTVRNLRSNLNRMEEIAYRQLGVQEALESWRFDDASQE